MNRVFLCLGGNLGNRLEYIRKAKALITKKIGLIVAQSGIYETPPWGKNSKYLYLNQVIEIRTSLEPEKLIETILIIEHSLGRIRTKNRNADRTIDIDILLIDNKIMSSHSLDVPHPRMHQREFVLKPLLEIYPDFMHPILKIKGESLLKKIREKVKIKKQNYGLYVCIEGNIGAGKTTLANKLRQKLKAKTILERYEHTPLLENFYKEPRKYALALELSLLFNRFEQIVQIKNNNNSTLIADFSFYKSLWFAQINFNKNDFKAFKTQFDLLETLLPKPDLIIYLEAPIKHLKNNITNRNRKYERKISKQYLSSINSIYNQNIAKNNNVPIIRLGINNYSKAETGRLLSDLTKTIKNY
ncbi:MAG: 2-amino-4-hydroxy-6-hydroxymethyldihydropteridine diphosphokinase [Bacteroidia bacterium]